MGVAVAQTNRPSACDDFEDIREDVEALIDDFELECELAKTYDQLPCPRIQHIGFESMAYILAITS
jgi:hypothetical protein